ncbi:WAP four-disulfide core domain protein 1-like [Gigantopelta aegis]|uniref:WAP four-disulfide core domain protein 1-like n=1 Tax=Gigantopelta aegis TaxID=1735272 RepID=UPI001B88D1F9|nr:WAP four-disulfide core domain protein 1-like [Gigantopelta aegis]
MSVGGRRPMSIVLTLIASVILGIYGMNLPKNTDAQKQQDLWLINKIDYDYMGDAPSGPGSVTDMCPPVPEVLPPGSCHVKVCNSDRECERQSRKCCYNGCTYTCLPEVGTPAYFDWLKQPTSRLSSGRSWLLNGPEFVNELESCSTSPVEEDEDPLLCPHGYVCNIEDPGSPDKGIPNSGHCVKEADDSQPEEELQKDNTPSEEMDPPEPSLHCTLDEMGVLVMEGADIKMEGKTCRCIEGSLWCDTS